MNMDYISKFVPADIKYDFIDSTNEPQITEVSESFSFVNFIISVQKRLK